MATQIQPMTESAAGAGSQYLTFLIAGEEYGLQILRVREIIQYDGVTRIPRAPAWVRGVINLRGSVVPVVDLRARFGIEEVQASRSTCIVVAEVRFHGESMVVGLLTDAVNAVVELRAQDLLPVPSFGTRARIEYLQGMARVDERLLLLLDVDTMLSSDEIAEATALADDAPAAAPAAPFEQATAPAGS